MKNKNWQVILDDIQKVNTEIPKNGKTLDELAAMAGIPNSTMQSRLKRAIQAGKMSKSLVKVGRTYKNYYY